MPKIHVSVKKQRGNIFYVIVCEVKAITPKCVYAGAGEMAAWAAEAGSLCFENRIGARGNGAKKARKRDVCGLFNRARRGTRTPMQANAHEPESCVSTNFTIRAWVILGCVGFTPTHYL